MSIIAQQSLLAVQANRVATPQRGSEAYAPRKRDDAGFHEKRTVQENEAPGQRKAPVDQVDIRVRADERRFHESQASQLAEQKQRTEAFEAKMREQDQDRQERLSRREAPHAGRQDRPPPSRAVH